MAVVIRKAVLGDLEVIVDFNKAMAQETESITIPDDIAHNGVEAVLLDKVSAMYYVIEKDGKVIAQLMITFEWSDWRNTNAWWIQSVYVQPEHRKNGYFKMLYDHVKVEAKAAGACGLRLYADVHNARAHSVYEKQGMTSHYKVYEDMFTSY